MIRYNLKCDRGHVFDSWFASAAAFERLEALGQLACAECGSSSVHKALMAPRVRPSRVAEAAAPGPDTPTATGPAAPAEPAALSQPRSAREAALAQLRREIEARSEYVGMEFAAEARRMHSGEAPSRSIHGEAALDEARALIEEGVPVAPLPFRPSRQSH